MIVRYSAAPHRRFTHQKGEGTRANVSGLSLPLGRGRVGGFSRLRDLPRLRLHAAVLEDQFGIAVRLGAALEDELAGGLEGDAGVEIRGHRLVERVVRVLVVDDRRHPAHRFHDLFFAADPVVQPVGDVLARDAQGRAVFHQADIVDVRHFEQPTP